DGSEQPRGSKKRLGAAYARWRVCHHGHRPWPPYQPAATHRCRGNRRHAALAAVDIEQAVRSNRHRIRKKNMAGRSIMSAALAKNYSYRNALALPIAITTFVPAAYSQE